MQRSGAGAVQKALLVLLFAAVCAGGTRDEDSEEKTRHGRFEHRLARGHDRLRADRYACNVFFEISPFLVIYFKNCLCECISAFVCLCV